MATALAETAGIAGSMVPQLHRVVRRRRETLDTWTLELEPEGGEPLAFAPGQFTMLYAFGIGEVPVSICVDEGTRLTHTIRDVGAVTRALCAAQPGATLGVRGPFGNAWPLDEAEGADVVIVAGGIGLAPLRGAIRRVLARRRAYGNVSILYGARTPADLLYPRELERCRGYDVHVEVTVDTAQAGWRARVGVVPKLVRDASFDPATALALVCGPEVMMRFTAAALLERGLAPERIHVSMERDMRCGLGFCGHCQLGPTLICRDGPIYRWNELLPLLEVREL
jgi:NAD(P)H-flavin reductase